MGQVKSSKPDDFEYLLGYNPIFEIKFYYHRGINFIFPGIVIPVDWSPLGFSARQQQTS